MFEWLDAEIASIRTRRFHRVDGPGSESARNTASEAAGLAHLLPGDQRQTSAGAERFAPPCRSPERMTGAKS